MIVVHLKNRTNRIQLAIARLGGRISKHTKGVRNKEGIDAEHGHKRHVGHPFMRTLRALHEALIVVVVVVILFSQRMQPCGKRGAWTTPSKQTTNRYRVGITLLLRYHFAEIRSLVLTSMSNNPAETL